MELRLPGRHRGAAAGAGFEVGRCWLEERPAQPREPASFLESVCLGVHLHRLPEALHEPYLDAVLEVLPRPLTLDYVRLNISARRP